MTPENVLDKIENNVNSLSLKIGYEHDESRRFFLKMEEAHEQNKHHFNVILDTIARLREIIETTIEEPRCNGCLVTRMS